MWSYCLFVHGLTRASNQINGTLHTFFMFRFNLKSETYKFLRFCAVGVLNSTISFLVFMLLRYLGVSIYVSNLASYIVGVINSFIWSKAWVYRSVCEKWLKEALLFVFFFLICYGLQLLVFRFLISSEIHELVSQVIGMAVFSGSNYLLNRLFNFKNE